MSLGITFQDTIANVQRLIMELVQVVHAVAHIHGDDFPRLEAKVSFFKQGLKLRTWHGFDGGGDFCPISPIAGQKNK